MNYNKWKRRYIVLTRDTLAYYTNDTFESLRGIILINILSRLVDLVTHVNFLLIIFASSGQFFLSPHTKASIEDGTTEKHRIKFMIQDPKSNQPVSHVVDDSYHVVVVDDVVDSYHVVVMMSLILMMSLLIL